MHQHIVIVMQNTGVFYINLLFRLKNVLNSVCFVYLLLQWTLLKNCVETEMTYRTSRSHSLFMFVLLFSFLLAIVPVGYMISRYSLFYTSIWQYVVWSIRTDCQANRMVQRAIGPIQITKKRKHKVQ